VLALVCDRCSEFALHCTCQVQGSGKVATRCHDGGWGHGGDWHGGGDVAMMLMDSLKKS
jgi:hypothetical protein